MGVIDVLRARRDAHRGGGRIGRAQVVRIEGARVVPELVQDVVVVQHLVEQEDPALPGEAAGLGRQPELLGVLLVAGLGDVDLDHVERGVVGVLHRVEMPVAIGGDRGEVRPAEVPVHLA